MSWAWLALLTLIGAGQETDAQALVQQLGAGRYAEREDAAEALEVQGRLALPALRQARQSRDPEVRARAAALVERIESSLLVRPTLVRLDFHDRPLAEVVKDLSDQTGMQLALAPDGPRRGPSPRITLQESEPVPFWQALDQLCSAARLRPSLGPLLFTGASELAAGVALTDNGGQALPGFVSDHGPFRVRLQRLHYERDLDFDPPDNQGGAAAATEQFQAQIQIMAEPRLLLGLAGALRMTEAVDDLSQSLLPTIETLESGVEIKDFIEFSPGPMVQLPVALSYPDRPGRLIRRMRGVVPLIVAARQPDPLVVPLVGSLGKTFRQGNLALTVESIRTDPNDPQVTIDLILRPGSDDGAGPFDADATAPAFLEHQFEVSDARGRHYLLFPQERSIQAGEVRITLILSPGDGATAPAHLRYYSLTRARTEVPFTFNDVRMP